MKFAFKFSMPKWERPKQEAPYISNPLINELEKVDFASLTAERRQDILHRLKLACADIAEDRRHQPAILSDRIHLQKMWQDYFKIAQTTPAGDNLGESLSISRYSVEEEEQKPRALGAVMTMQEELVAAANFKIDLGGLDINDMDDMDDFSPSSIPRAAPPPPPPPAQAAATQAPAPHAAAAHLAASHNAPAKHEADGADKTNAADQELAEQMAKIKAVAPMALPAMAFPSEPAPEQVALAVGSDAAFSIEVTGNEAGDEPQDAAQAHSPEDELAEQMAKIKAVAPMALPPMAFPSDPVQEQVAIAAEETAFSIEISEEPEPAEQIEAARNQDHDHDEELAEHMAKVKAVAPMALPPMPHPADASEQHAEAHADLRIEAHGPDDHPEIPLVIEEDTLHIHDGHLEDTAPAAVTIDADAVLAETITVVKPADQADASGFKPLTIAVVEAEPAPPELVEAEIVEPEIVEPQVVEPQVVTAVVEESPAVTEMPAVEHAAAETVEPVQKPPVDVAPEETGPVTATVPVEAEKPAEAKPKRSRKASALATLRSMLSSPQPGKPAPDDTPARASGPDAGASEAAAEAAQADLPQEAVAEEPVEAALPPKEREVSATPSTKEWVNIKLLRPSVIRGLPLPDQVITIVPYTEAKRLEENGSAIILTKPRTPRSSS